MTDDNAPRSSNPSPLITAARVAAVVLAIAVVAWLIVRAQRDADRQQREAPADAGAPASPTPGEGEGEGVDELLHGSKSAVLPSSKSLVIDPNMTVLPSSKFMPLPSSKGMVVEPPAGPRPATQPEKAKPEKEGGS